MIERIRIRNYRSLHEIDVQLGPLTVLIGRSGSGKSNIVRAIRLLRDALGGQQTEQVWQNQPFNAGQAALAYEVLVAIPGIAPLRYSLAYNYQPGPVADERLYSGDKLIFHQSAGRWVSEPKVDPMPPPGPVALGRLTGVREATVAHVALSRGVGVYDFPGTVLQENAPLERGPGYTGQGDSYLGVTSRLLDAIDRIGDWNAIVKSMAAVNTRLRSLDLLLPSRDRLLVGYPGSLKNSIFTADVLLESEGFRRYLAHLLALYQTPPKQTMFLEHPEHGIHPGALASLFEEFKSHVEDGRGQVILTTHSPQFLDHFEPEQLRVVVMEDGQTRIGPLAGDQFDALRKRLLTAGELLTVEDPRLDAPAEAGV